MQAEVQSINKDGTVMLHTRGTKYGRLQGGQLVYYPCQLIKRQRQHFRNISSDMRLIIGCNGLLWISYVPAIELLGTETEDTGNHEQFTVVPALVKSKISLVAAQLNSIGTLRIELNSKALLELNEFIKHHDGAECK